MHFEYGTNMEHGRTGWFGMECDGNSRATAIGWGYNSGGSACISKCILRKIAEMMFDVVQDVVEVRSKCMMGQGQQKRPRVLG